MENWKKLESLQQYIVETIRGYDVLNDELLILDVFNSIDNTGYKTVDEIPVDIIELYG